MQLNNFLHRIDCKVTMLELVQQHCCTVKRIRRSRNWLLTGEVALLSQLRDALRLGRGIWIAEAIDNALPKPTFNLALMLQANPVITVNQLMAETGCTLIEARCAIDAAENF
ncbi:MAG: hypothetical protein JKY55_19230 [Aliivibrio sp.]|nr:hypothetical protein [Aliivibrio sp.]